MTARRAARFAVAIAIVVLLWPTAASAHATIQKTEPAADAVLPDSPSQVILEFSEPVDVGLGGVKVVAPDGARVDAGTAEREDGGRRLVVAVDGERRGTYTVVWSVTSEDNHTIKGTLLYSVGAISGAAAIEDTSSTVARTIGGLGRWLAFLGTLLFVGAIAFDRIAATDEARTSWQISFAAATVVVLGATASLLAQIAISSGRSITASVGLVGDALTETRFGLLGAARILLGVAGAGAGLLLARSRPASTGLRWPVAVGLSIIPALLGHAWTVSPRLVSVTVDGVHLAAASVWIGGLFCLAVTARRQQVDTLRRFSQLALWSVIVVMATGSISSYLQVRSIDALFSTGYGVLLIVKIALVSVLIALGAGNRSRLRRATDADRSVVLKVVLTEAVIAVLVVAVTAALVNLPPARNDVARPFSGVFELSADQGSVQVEVQPAKVGTNDVHLYFLDGRGLPAPIDAVEVQVSRPGVPPRRVTVTPVTADHASAYAVSFPAAGAWKIEVTAVRAGTETTTEFEVQIR